MMYRTDSMASGEFETYYFEKNLQGDVIAVYNESGTVMIEYVYDAWGNAKYTYKNGADSTDARFNPFGYRGYYYDSDLGFYYLNSRYYDSVTGRFINADGQLNDGLLGYNLFAYCENNPVMYSDGSGCAPKWLGNLLTGVGIAVGTALFVAAIVASAGTVGALVGAGAAAIGLSSTAVSTVITVATVSTYVVAGGVGVFGASDAAEAFSGGTNPIRDYIMGGNQTAYNTVSGLFNALGAISTTAGMIGPRILQQIAQKWGMPKISHGNIVGHSMDFFDKNGDWSFRIDATTHGNPNSSSYHHNPHYHVVNRGGDGTAVYSIWEIIKGWFNG